MMFWIWWLEICSHWLAVLDVAVPPPPRGPPPEGRPNIINLADWRRSHPDHNGWAA
jgi:hypothetical protein